MFLESIFKFLLYVLFKANKKLSLYNDKTLTLYNICVIVWSRGRTAASKGREKKMTIRERVLQEVVETELFHTYHEDANGDRVYRYEEEGYDKDKIEAEGSTWIVYVHDCLSDFYNNHKNEIDCIVHGCLIDAANA